MRITVFLLLLPAIASAWGVTGHEIVCEIAFQELSPDARREVIRLIRLDTQYDSFAESCNWPDQPRLREPEHYMNVPRSFGAIAGDECPRADTCVFPAIRSDFQILSDKFRTDQERLDALRFLGHWVGDIHQPLHVSYQDDRGANNVETIGMCEGNLHGAWDGCMIEREMGTDSRTIADGLLHTVSAADRLSWQHDSPIEWANESYQITISPETDYCDNRDGACWHSADNMLLNDGEEPRVVTVDQRYISAHRTTIEQRLKQAGIRLGAMLNEALQ